MDKELKKRIREGAVERRDVVRRLAELAFGEANDCVRLALEENPCLDQLDLSLLSEVRRSDKGMVEVRLMDRMELLQQLARVLGEENGNMDAFLKALQGGGET